MHASPPWSGFPPAPVQNVHPEAQVLVEDGGLASLSSCIWSRLRPSLRCPWEWAQECPWVHSDSRTPGSSTRVCLGPSPCSL